MSEIIKDMLVKLYDLDADAPVFKRVAEQGIMLKRVMACEKGKVKQYIIDNFGNGWANEAEAAMNAVPANCYIAVKDKKIVGFAAFEATGKNFFGPIGVSPDMRGTGVGHALTRKCLISMREMGYSYAIIGWVDTARDFYKKTVGAIDIEDSHPGIYKNLTFL